MRSVKKFLGLKVSPNPQKEDTEWQQDADPTVLDWLKDIRPSGNQFLQYLIQLFPFLNWIKHYNIQWLVGDLIAGMKPATS